MTKCIWRDLPGMMSELWLSHKTVANNLKMRAVAHHSRVSGKPTPSGLDFVVYNSMSSVPLDLWDRCNRDNDIFLSSAYLLALEQAPPANMQFRYVIFTDQGNPAAIGYFQILALNHRLHRPAMHFLRLRKRTTISDFHTKIADAISHHILVCGNALLSGEHGYAATVSYENQVIHALAEAAYAIRKSAKKHISATLIKDFYDRNTPRADVLARFGYYPFDVGPNMIVPIREDWTSFDEYLKQMKSKYRKRATNVIKKGAVIQRQTLNLDEITEYKDTLYALYSEVVDKSKPRLFFLSPDYFIGLKKRIGDQFVCDGYFEGEDMIGFTTRIINGRTMEGYTHGMRYEQNKAYELYQNFLLDDIKAAITVKCSQINTGRTSMAMKSSVGAVPDNMKCYIRSTGRLSNQLIKPLFYVIKPSYEYCRHPFENSGC